MLCYAGAVTKENKSRGRAEGGRTRRGPYKVMGGEELTVTGQTVKAHAFTDSARSAIEAAGGTSVILHVLDLI